MFSAFIHMLSGLLFNSVSESRPAHSSRTSEGQQNPEGWVTKDFNEKEIKDWEIGHVNDFFDSLNLKYFRSILETKKKVTFSNGKDLLSFFSDSKNFNIFQSIEFRDDYEFQRSVTILRCLFCNMLASDSKSPNMDFYRVMIKEFHWCEKELKIGNKNITKKELAKAYREINIVRAAQLFRRDSSYNYLNMHYRSKLSNYVSEMEEKKLNINLRFSNRLQKSDVNVNDTKEIEKKVKGFFPVKLILTDTPEGDLGRAIRPYIAPILSKIKRYDAEFGLFHAALMIGPLYLEWTTKAIVVDKDVKSSNAICAIDFDEIGLLERSNTDEIASIISKHVHKWNTLVKYSMVKSDDEDDENFGNCQNFVTSLMKDLKLKYPKKFFSDFFENLRSGKGDLFFRPSKKLFEVIKLKKSYTFVSHKELDEFVEEVNTKLSKTIGSSIVRFGSDFRILKSFDRGLWLRYIQKKSKEKDKSFNSQIEDLEESLSLFKKRLKTKKDVVKEDVYKKWKKDHDELEKKLKVVKKDRELLLIYSPKKKGCPFDDPRESHSFKI